MTDIKLTIPAKPENILAIRLFASGIAMRCGFDVQRIEDIKTAISESCVLLLSGSEGGRLILSVDTEEQFTIVLNKVSTTAKQADEDYMPELSRMLLEALSNEVKITEVDGDCVAVKLIF